MTGEAPELDDLLAHVGWVERLSQQLCRDRDAAADAAQEVWLRALQSPPKDRSNVRAFLATCLRNVLRGRARSDVRRVRREQSVAGTAFAEASAEVAARAAWHRVLAREVQSLPEPQRTLILLHYLEGKEVTEVATASGLTPDAVRAHLRRARGVLRSRLEQRSGNDGLATLVVAATMSMKAKVALGVAAAGLLCWLAVAVVPAMWSSGASNPLPPSLEQGSAVAAAGAGADMESGSASDPLGTSRSTHGVQRKVQCRLLGLHADAAWTTPIRMEIGGRNKAMDFYPKQQFQVLPDTDGTFVVELPAWVDQCVNQFRVLVRARDPFYMELEARDYAASFEASPFGRDGVMEFMVHPCGQITGTVKTEAGDPVPAVAVHALFLQEQRPIGNALPMAYTGARGQFTLQVPMHAEVLVVAMPMRLTVVSGLRLTGPDGGVMGNGRVRQDLQAASVRSQSRFGASNDVGVMTVRATGVVKTRVLADGEPLPGIEVECHLDERWAVDIGDNRLIGLAGGDVHAVPGLWSSQRLRTNHEGRCELHLPRGVGGEVLLMRNARSREPLIGKRRVTAPALCQFDLATPLTVRVEQGGEPVVGAAIVVDGVVERYRCNADGEVRFSRERAVPVPLTIHAPGCAAFAAVAAADATGVAVITVPSVDTVPIRLQVTCDTFLAMMHGVLEALDRDVTAMPFGCRRVEGEPFVLHAPPGRYRMRLLPRYDHGETPDNAVAYLCDVEQVITVSEGGAEVQVQAALGGRLTVSIVDRRGVRLGGNLQLIAASGVALRPRFWHQESPGEPGVLTRSEPSKSVSYYAPGTYQVVVDLGANGLLRRQVTIRAEEQCKLEVQLP